MENIEILTQEIVAKLSKNKDVLQLVGYLNRISDQLDQNSDMPDDWTNEKRGGEALARKRARQQIQKVVRPFNEYLPDEEKVHEEEGSLYLGHLGEE